MAPRTHYEVLGVRSTATQAEVRAAYRAAARDHHPDAGGDAGRMRALNVAWAVLGDPTRRAAYDRALAGGSVEDERVTWPAGRGFAGASPPADDDVWPLDPDTELSAEEWADLADARPIAPTMALRGWWAILPPGTFVASVGLFGGSVVFTSPALMALSAGAFVLSVGLFVLAPLRAMTRRPGSR
ncbi:MAG TPA: DnaJ domain-containing protein [Acidimicrobiales bacterium]|jgi:curved DNA-binding protein CbpA|nr:DnaJ domain-containing protein [Acidimicrobiales bacterium]